MLTIHLTNLKFKAYHGVHDEEQILGNELELNVSVEAKNITEKITRLNQTINYVSLYQIIQKRMSVPTPLLETVAQDITDLFFLHDKRITSVDISIKKLTPPISNFNGQVCVSFKKDR